MSGTHIHALVNGIIWYGTFFLFYLINHEVPFFSNGGLLNGVWFVIGGIIFDLDHLVYYVYTTKPLKFFNIKETMEKDFEENNPHLYVCHTIEFCVISLIISIYSGALIAILMISGWIIHMLVDTFDYIKCYRSWKPWLQYFFLIYYLSKGKK